MHWKSVLFGAAVAAAALLTADRVFSDDEDADDEAGLPGEEHERLEAYEGTWDSSGTYWSKNGTVAVTGHQTGRMIMGGRFLEFESDFSMADDSAWKQLEIFGYDYNIDKYVHFGIEDDHTLIWHDEGDYDAANHLLVMRGADRLGGGNESRFRYTVSDVVDGAFRYEHFERDVSTGERTELKLVVRRRR